MSEPAPRLFTPGPLTTSPTVRQAMMQDLGSRDPHFLEIVDDVRDRLLNLAGTSREQGFESILMQGSGTFGIESVIGSAIGSEDRLLVIVNGAYGKRIHQIASAKHLDCDSLSFDEREIPELDVISHRLSEQSYTHLAVVHCETTTGILNPIRDIGQLADRHGTTFIVDAMSSFGAVPVDVHRDGIDFLISSANKCLQGVPGFSFVICNRRKLLSSKHTSTSVSLDLRSQLRGLETNGQFRFTPPTHAILAFHQALNELDAEGGVAGRAERYKQNQSTLVKGMRELGFGETIRPELQGHIITSFEYPADEKFDFSDFYSRLSQAGFVIYPGKLGSGDCFRIGNIGHLFQSDMLDLLEAIRQSLADMRVGMTSPTSAEAKIR